MAYHALEAGEGALADPAASGGEVDGTVLATMREAEAKLDKVPKGRQGPLARSKVNDFDGVVAVRARVRSG